MGFEEEQELAGRKGKEQPKLYVSCNLDEM